MSDPDQAGMARVHHALIGSLLQGRASKKADVAMALNVDVAQVDAALGELAAAHGVVLDPHSGEPWVIHPFSLTPTATWVEHDERGWWAPCPWCAFGIAGLAGGNATIHTRLGAEAEPIAIHVVSGEVVEEGLLIHFPTPPRTAWDNVHRFCSTVLPFRDDEEVDRWCARHGIARGRTIPVRQACELGRRWYGRHADADWRKWTGAQADSIFEEVGLSEPFWRFERSGTPV